MTCTTHHDACDCRQDDQAELVATLREGLRASTAELARVTTERDAYRQEATRLKAGLARLKHGQEPTSQELHDLLHNTQPFEW